MKLCKTINEIRQAVKAARDNGKIIGFVPTMGALHVGHETLIKQAADKCGFVVVSIFVNPTQFEPGSDYNAYPRTLDADMELCKRAGASAVFAPSASEMYPQEVITWVNVERLTDGLCGQYRPGHFKGVTTVCDKLFNIVLPDKAYFGQKDAQQLAVIKRMVADLNMPLEIVGCATVREESGLAMSSRNKYLTDAEKKEAALIYASLQLCEVLFEVGEKDAKTLMAEMRKLLANGPNIKVQYIEIVDTQNLQPLDKITGSALVAIAVHLGKARLIDNITI
jgi:pantoate--beta-alanine ligase